MGWSGGTMANRDRRGARFAEVRSLVGEVYGGELHAKRIDSLAGRACKVMGTHAASRVSLSRLAGRKWG